MSSPNISPKPSQNRNVTSRNKKRRGKKNKSSPMVSMPTPPVSIETLSISTSPVPIPTPTPAPSSPARDRLRKTSEEFTPPSSPSTKYLPSTSSPPSPTSKIILGICAMDKKSRSKPMAEILSRLDPSLFVIKIFGDEVILKATVEDWPVVDVLIAFFSSGFPLDKAEKYVSLRRPFVLNDLAMQRTLMDRRKVYDLMEASGIDVPRHVYCSRDGYVSKGSGAGDGSNKNELVEYDDHIEVNGVEIHKPFVEKPIDADDHNVHIYYPQSAGGGAKKLFRKIGNRSSEFHPDVNEVRREGSFIYEEFVETQGTDVKMYTVGPDYGHAEARKSPAVDGKVMRNADGKEVRFPVILSLREKEIARRIVLVFKQQVCGFDLLRVQEGDSLVSYCCDVNGWSFVKNSRKYYDDCAQLLCEYMLAAVKPRALQGFSAIDPLLSTYATWSSNTPEKPNAHVRSTTQPNAGSITNPSFFDDPSTPSRDEDSEISKILTPKANEPLTLEEGAKPVREISNALSLDPPSRCSSVGNEESEGLGWKESNQNSWTGSGPVAHQEELRCVIAVIRHGDRTPKQKLKLKVDHPLFLEYYMSTANGSKKDLKIKAKQPLLKFLEAIKIIITEKELEKGKMSTLDPATEKSKKLKKELYKLHHMRDVLERWKISGLNRKLQIKPTKWNDETDSCTQLMLIMKWGGNLTKLGERQALTLGQRFRHEMYPDPSGGGILRLHSTFRHDLKIKTSDEGRVMKTAAAFAKGMLELEGELPPILVSLVHKEKESVHMLDPSGNKEVKVALEACKEKLHKQLQLDYDFDKAKVGECDVLEQMGVVSESSSMYEALKNLRNPRTCLFSIHKTIGELLEQLDDMLGLQGSGAEEQNEEGEGLKAGRREDEALSGIKLYKGETLLELTERWRLLHNKLYDDESEEFDLTKIPDVHDNVRFDMLHNPHLGLSSTLATLYKLAKLMADCVVPQEYGITIKEKREVGTKMCKALIEKIKYDLIIAKTDNQVDMRYMIDLSHSADLAINTLGRRIRTRLYFTSESHLHTLLNVLRFIQHDSESTFESPLDKNARKMIKETPELCYLTQIVFRLFEDTKKSMEDPKRFRVEIGFSPGATATPLHMSEKSRDGDNTRFDTASIQPISKEMLTCDELENYFIESIKNGYSKEESDEEREKVKKKKDKDKRKESIVSTPGGNTGFTPGKWSEATSGLESGGSSPSKSLTLGVVNESTLADSTASLSPRGNLNVPMLNTPPMSPSGDASPRKENAKKKKNKKKESKSEKVVWGGLAMLSLVLAGGCFLLARSIKSQQGGGLGARRYSRR